MVPLVVVGQPLVWVEQPVVVNTVVMLEEVDVVVLEELEVEMHLKVRGCPNTSLNGKAAQTIRGDN